ncbi:dienelactone hydrolase family protein [Nocardia stercoris]|uniref:Alpha/beta hydrolase n=1 Tax=Nocardia stercoris TaxID=2483361 RepID=A0A3M2KUN8_9NOCA|nr:alpha/beta hydrolase [Nocardia stercoris]RMI27933.1 alpha/beta hydrolase [Nocardia stercoris]
MNLTAATTHDGVVERAFTLGDVTGVLWSPETPTADAPLILMGHTGGLHKKSPGLVARARNFVTGYGYTVAAIDAPGHGDRPRDERDQQWVAEMSAARAAGESMRRVITDYNASLAERAVPEWQATIDALQALPEVGAGPIGYAGTTLGTAIGLMLTAVESRIRVAEFGPVFVYEALLESARKLTIPVRFQLAWDDPEIDRELGLELFGACGSADKALHAFPGAHQRIPRTEIDISARFFARHLRGDAAA